MLSQSNAYNLSVMYSKISEYSNFLKNDKIAHIFTDLIMVNLTLGWLGNLAYFVTSFKLKRKSQYYIYLYYILIFDVVSCVNYIFWLLDFKNLGLFRQYGITFYMANFIRAIDELCSINVNYMTVIQVIDQTMAICKPFLYKTYFTFKRVMIITISLTICNILIAIPYTVTSKIQTVCVDYINFDSQWSPANQNYSYHNITECKNKMYYRWPIKRNWRNNYDMIVLFSKYLLPVIIAIIGNLTMIVVLHKRNKKIRSFCNSLTNPTEEVRQNTHENSNRSKTSFRFYKLIMAQCAAIICFNIPYMSYFFYVGSQTALKNISLESRRSQIMVEYVKLSYPLLGVYVHMFFDPDIILIFKKEYNIWRKK
ncbi:unnamed protein product [Gordionus sp. m RMFG-2023]